MDMEEDPLVARIGTFFLVIGFGSLILFIASDLAHQPDFDYFFVAIVLIAIGWTFRRKKSAPPPSGRFSMFSRMGEDARRRRADRLKSRQDKK
jgi:hypothetical protein